MTPLDDVFMMLAALHVPHIYIYIYIYIRLRFGEEIKEAQT
jgi:hypothetical protein